MNQNEINEIKVIDPETVKPEYKCECCNGTGIVEGDHYDDLHSCNNCLGRGNFNN